VRRSSETVASLRERVSGLEARLNELTLETAALLDSDELERESALVTTSGVIEAKLSRAREKLFQAEGALSAQLAGVKGEFGRLHLIFKLWRVEIEKRKLSAEMVSGCPNLSLEHVCLHLKVIAGLRELEITAQEPEGLVRQAEGLLEAIQRESEFVVPPASGSASESVAAAPAPESWCGPWDDGTVDIQAEIRALPPRVRTRILTGQR
jgi:hypothetical protein